MPREEQHRWLNSSYIAMRATLSTVSRELERRRYLSFLVNAAVILSIFAILIALLEPDFDHRGSGHPETRTTYTRATIWLQAANEFERQNGRSIESVEELEAFVFSDECHSCNVANLKFDWWGTPFRIWIDDDKYGRRRLNVQSARWNRMFEETDKTWTIDLAEMPDPQVPEQFLPASALPNDGDEETSQ